MHAQTVFVRWRLRGSSDGRTCGPTVLCTLRGDETFCPATLRPVSPLSLELFSWYCFLCEFSFHYLSYKCLTSCSGCSAECKTWFFTKKISKGKTKKYFSLRCIIFFSSLKERKKESRIFSNSKHINLYTIKKKTNLNYRHHVIINFSSNCWAHSSVETLL